MLRTLLLTAAALALVVPASAQGMKMEHGRMSHATPSDKAYAAAMNKMMGSMDVRPTGDPDRDFVTMMLPHHQGAVDMAQVELKYGRDPKLLELARAVVAAQGKEIAFMREWQAQHPK